MYENIFSTLPCRQQLAETRQLRAQQNHAYEVACSTDVSFCMLTSVNTMTVLSLKHPFASAGLEV